MKKKLSVCWGLGVVKSDTLRGGFEFTLYHARNLILILTLIILFLRTGLAPRTLVVLARDEEEDRLQDS